MVRAQYLGPQHHIVTDVPSIRNVADCGITATTLLATAHIGGRVDAKWSHFHAAISVTEMPPNAAINVRGATMNVVTPIAIGPAETSSEREVEGNIHELVRTSAAVRRDDRDDEEISASGLDILLRRVSENSTREIDNLIGDLQRLRKKLQTDGNRVQRDIADYTALNQQVMQLTKIISESVTKLPNAPSIST